MSRVLFLASKSPRRRELLEQIGVRFSVLEVDVPELHQVGESAQAYVERLSSSKAKAGAKVSIDDVVLGADTIVVVDGRIIEKPESKQQAVDMLLSLSGRSHCVLTAVALCRIDAQGAEHLAQRVCQSDVHFREISAAEAESYWQTGEPCDKAGGYGIQGMGAVFVERLKGSYSNVVGLPLMETQQLLSDFGISVWNMKEPSVTSHE